MFVPFLLSEFVPLLPNEFSFCLRPLDWSEPFLRESILRLLPRRLPEASETPTGGELLGEVRETNQPQKIANNKITSTIIMTYISGLPKARVESTGGELLGEVRETNQTQKFANNKITSTIVTYILTL